MSYSNYNGFAESSYNSPGGQRVNMPPYANYETPGSSRIQTYDRYVPAQDSGRLRTQYGDSYRPDGDSYRPGMGDSYRPESWRYPSTHAGDHYEPGSEADEWRGQDSWSPGYQRQYHERERRTANTHWEPEHRDTMAERMFEPSDAWMSSHHSFRGPPREGIADQFTGPQIRDYRSTSPSRRSREGYNSFYPSPASGDFYRPEPSSLPTADARYARSADCYRPTFEDEEPFASSSYVPDAQPGPHWRRGRSRSPRDARIPFEGSHWDPEHDRSFSGSDSRSRSRSSRSPDRRGNAANLRARSRSSSVSSVSRRHILPSRPLPLPTRPTAGQSMLSITTDSPRALSFDQTSPTSAKFKQIAHPSLPPRPMLVPRDRAHYVGDDVTGTPYIGQGSRGSSPNDQRKRKTRRGGAGRRRPSGVPNGSPVVFHAPPSPTKWPILNTGSPTIAVSSDPYKSQEYGTDFADLQPKDSGDAITMLEDLPASSVGREPERHSRSPSLSPPIHLPQQLPLTTPQEASSALSDNAPPEHPLSPAKSLTGVSLPAAGDSSQACGFSHPPVPRALELSVSSPPHVSEPMTESRELDSAPPLTEITNSLALSDAMAIDSPAAASPVNTDVSGAELLNSDQSSGSGQSLQGALQIVISTRQSFDKQTRQERVAPILLANKDVVEHRATILNSLQAASIESPSPDQRQTARMELIAQIGARLDRYATTQKQALAAKQDRLRAEYLELHKAWIKRCEDLDHASQQQLLSAAVSLEDASATAPGGRTTRRSAAVVGDTVRSDLEMEQIIASLGNEDLFDPAILATKNVARIPDMISVTRGEIEYFFDDTNCAIDNPAAFYDPGPGMSAWTEEEQRTFVEQYAAHPKQFGKIAEALPNKTANQCVLFYYLHKKKLLDFRKAVATFGRSRGRGRGRGAKKKGNALLADIQAHDAAVREGEGGKARKRRAAAVAAQSISTGANAGRRGPRRTTLATEVAATPGTTTPTPEPEARPKRRRTTKVVPEGMDQGDGSDSERPAKKAKRGRKPKVVTVTPDEDDADDGQVSKAGESSKGEQRRRAAGWTDKDKMAYIELLSQHGDNWEAIAVGLGNKTPIQAMSFYKANMVELQLDGILETHRRKKGIASDASVNGTPVDVGTPVSESPATAAPSTQGSPAPPTINMNSVPMLVGPKVYPYGFPPQPPAGGWPMAPLGASPVDFLVSGVYQVPPGYPSTSTTQPYQYPHHLRL